MSRILCNDVAKEFLILADPSIELVIGALDGLGLFKALSRKRTGKQGDGCTGGQDTRRVRPGGNQMRRRPYGEAVGNCPVLDYLREMVAFDFINIWRV